MDTHEFEAELERLDGKIMWTVIHVPSSISDIYGTRGRIPIQACIDGHEFTSMLLRSRKGHYMVCNKKIRDACQKGLGDSVHVAIQFDPQSRTVEIPAYLTAYLADRPDIVECFERQPDYMKREQLQFIEAAKKEETRVRRIKKLVQGLQDRND